MAEDITTEGVNNSSSSAPVVPTKKGKKIGRILLVTIILGTIAMAYSKGLLDPVFPWIDSITLFCVGILFVVLFWKKARSPKKGSGLISNETFVPKQVAKMYFDITKGAAWMVILGFTLCAYALLTVRMSYLHASGTLSAMCFLFLLVLILKKTLKNRKEKIQKTDAVESEETAAIEPESPAPTVDSMPKSITPAKVKRVPWKAVLVGVGLITLLGIGYFLSTLDWHLFKNNEQDMVRKSFIADSIAIAEATKAKQDSSVKIKAQKEAILAENEALRADSASRSNLQSDFVTADTTLCADIDAINAVFVENQRLKNVQKTSLSTDKICTNVLKVSIEGTGVAIVKKGRTTIVAKHSN